MTVKKSKTTSIATIAPLLPGLMVSFKTVGKKLIFDSSDLSNVTVLVKKGKLPQFSHAIEGHLRERLKLPTFLNEGTVELLQDVFLAKDGVRITADQSRLLKLFGELQASAFSKYELGCAIADFNVKLVSKWEKSSSEFTMINALTAWDKRTYNTITVEGDDQK